MKAFDTFKLGGRQYLAVPCDAGAVSIVGEDGAHYGSWRDGAASFIDAVKSGRLGGNLVLGRAVLRVVFVGAMEDEVPR